MKSTSFTKLKDWIILKRVEAESGISLVIWALNWHHIRSNDIALCTLKPDAFNLLKDGPTSPTPVLSLDSQCMSMPAPFTLESDPTLFFASRDAGSAGSGDLWCSEHVAPQRPQRHRQRRAAGELGRRTWVGRPEDVDDLSWDSWRSMVRFRTLPLGARTLLGAPGIATSNKCHASSNKKLLETSALLVVTIRI